jgi:phage shock protein C
MYCNYCGKVIPEDAIICVHCNKSVGAVPARKHLIRPRTGRKIAGVALAFAEYFDLDVSLIRVIWLLVAIFGGTGIVAYLVCWIVIPSEPEIQTSDAKAAATTSSPVGSSSITAT